MACEHAPDELPELSDDLLQVVSLVQAVIAEDLDLAGLIVSRMHPWGDMPLVVLDMARALAVFLERFGYCTDPGCIRLAFIEAVEGQPS